MDCHKCKNPNRADSKFCRLCGEPQLGLKSSPKEDFSPLSSRIRPILHKKISRKVAIIAIGISLLAATSAYASTRAKEYFEVKGAIKTAQEKSIAGDYKGALSTIATTVSLWSTDSQKRELEKIKSADEKFVVYQAAVTLSEEKEKSGLHKEARDLLQSVGSDYPQYEQVRTRLSDIQAKIEGDLQAKATAATAAKAAAENRARAEAAAKIRAEADAQAAVAAQARSDAAAAASAQAAQQATAQRAEQVKRSFRNELTAGYNSFNQARTYYGSAIQYSNNGSSISAISMAGSARATLGSARSTVSDLNSRYTGLSSDYYTAASNMVTAIDYLNNALDLLVSSEGTTLDYSSSINSNKNSALIYAGYVKSFLDANYY